MPNTDYGKLIRDGVNYSHDTAESISYDNTTSGLTAENAQDAIDELAAIPNGHDIIDDNGTEMTMREGLQFVGSYNTDDSTNDKTVVNVIRTMTEAQRAQLSQAEQKGFIYTTDSDNTPLTASEVIYNLGEGNTTDVQTVLDNMDMTGSAQLWSPNANATVTVNNRNIYKKGNGILHIWFGLRLVEALTAGSAITVVDSVDTTFGVLVSGNAHKVLGCVNGTDALFTIECFDNALIIKAINKDIGTSSSYNIACYIALPIL